MSVKAAGGYIIQPLPDADEEIINRIEKKIAEVPAISTLVEQGRTPEEILEILLGEFELKLLGKTSLKFKCDCNRERLERVVLGLGKEELEDIIQTEGEAELTCHYCNTKYHFSKEQLESLLAHA